MSELDELKKENRRLKSLLKNAVKLLNTYKRYLQDTVAPETRKGVAAGKAARPAKPRKKVAKSK